MQKQVLAFLIVLFSCSFCFAGDEFNFRGATWGMDQTQVANVETGNLVEFEDVSPQFICYELAEPVFGIAAGDVFYQFTGKYNLDFEHVPVNLLRQISYVLGAYNAEAQPQAVTDYDRIFAILTEQYGAPVLCGVRNEGRMTYTFGPGYNGLNAAELDTEAEKLLPVEELKFAVWNGPQKDYVVNLRLNNNGGAMEMYFIMALNESGPTWQSWRQGTTE